MARMTKADIIESVYEKVGGFSKKEAAEIVETVFNVVKETLEKGEKINLHEEVVCFDAGTGKELWRKRLDVYHTTVPMNRVGLRSPSSESNNTLPVA